LCKGVEGFSPGGRDLDPLDRAVRKHRREHADLIWLREPKITVVGVLHEFEYPDADVDGAVAGAGQALDLLVGRVHLALPGGLLLGEEGV
jgi:hypothetical protein